MELYLKYRGVVIQHYRKSYLGLLLALWNVQEGSCVFAPRGWIPLLSTTSHLGIARALSPRNVIWVTSLTGMNRLLEVEWLDFHTPSSSVWFRLANWHCCWELRLHGVQNRVGNWKSEIWYLSIAHLTPSTSMTVVSSLWAILSLAWAHPSLSSLMMYVR